jgi:chorismate mutase
VSKGGKSSLFDQNKSHATKIFKDTRSSLQQVKPGPKKADLHTVMDSMDTQAINELEEKDMLDMLYRQVVGQNYKDDKILDSLNKRIKHMNRVRKLKREQEQQRKKTKTDVQYETQVMIESLMMLCDPYMQ